VELGIAGAKSDALGMGKPLDVGQGAAAIGGGGGGGGGGGVRAVAGAIGWCVSFRCVFVLALAVGVLVPALSLLLPSRHQGYVSDDPDVLAGEPFAFERLLIRPLGCCEGSVRPGLSLR
jgi:hypothetical protein